MSVRAKLFTHGGSQAVRLPKAFRFEGTEVTVRKEGDRVILEPLKPDWASFWQEIDALADSEDPFPYPPPQALMADPIHFDR